MYKNMWGVDVSASFEKTQEVINKLNFSIPVLEISNALERVMPVANFEGISAVLEVSKRFDAIVPKCNIDGVTAALANLSAIMDRYADMGFSEQIFQGLAAAMKALPEVRIPNLSENILARIDAEFHEFSIDHLNKSHVSVSLKCTSDDKEVVISAIDENNNTNNSASEGVRIAEDTREELASDIEQVLTNPKRAQAVSESKYLKWKERHPILADLFLSVVLGIITNLIWAILSTGFSAMTAYASKDAKVYDEPSADSSVVYNITVEQNVTIIGEARYYYEIEVPDTVTEDTIVGYVYKGNLTIAEK